MGKVDAQKVGIDTSLHRQNGEERAIDCVRERIKGGVSQQPEKISDSLRQSMQTADLQEMLMALDIKKMSEADIENAFRDYEHLEIANKLKDRIRALQQIRDQFNDSELLTQLCGFPAKGSFDIEMTPVSFRVGVYGLKNWAKLSKSRNALIQCLVTKGMSRDASFSVGGKEQLARVDFYLAISLKKNSIKYHETRHSLNKALGSKEGNIEFKEESDKEAQVQKMIYDVARFKLVNLKDELSAYLMDGTPKTRLKWWTFRPTKALGLYDFHNMPESFWSWLKGKGFGEEDIGRVQKSVAEKINVSEITNRSYAAVDLLKKKGYSHSWSISFLSVRENLLEDWFTLAQNCPDRK